MKKLLLALLFLPFSILGQCDLEILDFNVNDATITVAFNNTNNCGGTGGPDGISEIQFGFQAIDSNCNTMNIGWDFPSGISIPDNSTHPGWLYSATTTEIFGNWTNNYGPELQPPYYTGDTLTFPLDNVYQSTNINTTSQLANNLQYWYDEGYSIQAVIWQISYGPTMYAADGGWAEVGVNGDGTSWGSGLYEDANFLDNWIIVGPCEEPEETLILDECNDPIACNYNNQWFESGGFCIYCDTPNGEELCNEYHGEGSNYWEFYFNAFDCPEEVECDTVYIELPPDTIYEIDTLIITVTEIDTLYIELPPDTIIVTEIDTLYIELPPDTVTETIFITDTITVTETEFIFVTDTVIETEYIYSVDTIYIIQSDTVTIYEFVEIDCETGLPCSEIRNEECNIYIPNAFTPDNDGYNDGWEIVLDPECWTDVKVQVISRWGNIVWESYDVNNLVWNGNFRGGDYYVQNEMYLWWFQARKVGTAEVKELRGHVTILR